MTNQEYLVHLGVSRSTWFELRRICRKLHKLDEMACDGEIQCDDYDGQWYHYNPDQYGSPTIKGKVLRTRPLDLLRVAADLVHRYGLSVYHQSDPRGCSLYVYNQSDLERCSRGSDPAYGISSYYNTIGTAVC